MNPKHASAYRDVLRTIEREAHAANDPRKPGTPWHQRPAVLWLTYGALCAASLAALWLDLHGLL